VTHTGRPATPIVLTIAGSDPSGGAGIQADLKTFAALGVYGVSALTAITSQNTRGVLDVMALPADTVRAQIDAIATDLPIAAVKTGMLATSDTVAAVVNALQGRRHIVVDPVMAASRGGILLTEEAVSIMTSALFPLATVVTPNVPEASRLSGTSVTSVAAARDAAKRIQDHGPEAVVIKGGHLGGAESIDLLFYRGDFIELAATRVNVGAVHGTGCTFASAIAARLALGDDIPAAVDRAKRYVTGAIARSFALGAGDRVLNHFWEFSL
jgi:hydroxymethylpyrimidine kinase/phosphomethylpyrimidine kinase